MSVLAIEDLRGGYGDIQVVNGFSARVEQGEAVFVTGRNGVGKTTLLRLVAGSLTPSHGQVLLDEEDVTMLPGHRRSGLGMGYAPQEQVVFGGLTVAENLTLHHNDRSLSRYDRLFVAFPRMKERLQQQAGTLSGGEKKILSFCRAIAESTGVVLLDEPTEGVQPENIDRMAAEISREKSEGRAFLIVEQNLGLVQMTADRAYLIDHGDCVFESESGPDLRDRLAERMQI